MTDLEDRLRIDLHDLADRLVDAPYERSRRPSPTDSPRHAAHSRSRWVGAVAAAAVVLAGAAGLVGIRDARDGASSETTPDDSSGPLFVLPAASSGLTLTNATVSSGSFPADEVPIDRALVARVAGEIISDFSLVSVAAQRQPDDREWRTQDSEIGEVNVVEGDPLTILAQRRGDFWVTVETRADVDHALTALAGIAVSSRGRIDVEPGASLIVVDRSAHPTGMVTGVYTDIDDPGGTYYPIVVETGSSTHPLATVWRVGGSAEPMVAANALGWHVFRDDPDGEWNGFVWQATSNQMVAVSGHVGLDEIIDVAESLEIVDESTWRGALPNATFTTDP